MKKKNKRLLLFSSAIVIIILLLIFGFNVLQTEFVVYNNYNKNFTFQNIDFVANSNQDFTSYSYSSNPRYGDVCTTNTLNTIDSNSILDIKLLRGQSRSCETPEPISTSIQSTNLKLVPSELKILRLNGYVYSSCSHYCDEVVSIYLVDENGNYKLLSKSEAPDQVEDYVYDITLERTAENIYMISDSRGRFYELTGSNILKLNNGTYEIAFYLNSRNSIPFDGSTQKAEIHLTDIEIDRTPITAETPIMPINETPIGCTINSDCPNNKICINSQCIEVQISPTPNKPLIDYIIYGILALIGIFIVVIVILITRRFKR